MIEAFHFLRPWWLITLVPFSILIYRRVKREVRVLSPYHEFPEHIKQALTVGEQGWTKHGPIVLFGVMVLCAVLVVAGPSWKRQVSPIQEDTSPLVIVLDVSNSMLQSDIAPNRLFHAKQKIKQLIETRETGTTALVVYSGSAHLAMPLTKDFAVFTPLLEAIKPEVMPRKGKFEQYSISMIREALTQSAQSATILLVTDAINVEQVNAWRKFSEQDDHQLLIWGMGDPDSNDAQPLDIGSLDRLADETNGEVILYRPDAKDVEQVANRIQSHLERSGDSAQPWLDSGYWLIWLIIPIYLMWARKGWIIQWSVVLILSSTVLSPQVQASEFQFIDLWLTKDQQGQLLYNEGDYQQAAITYENSQWKAVSFYMAQDYENAKSYFLRTDNLSSQLGVGASLAHQREYLAARDWFAEMLKHYPDNSDVKANLALMNAIIEHINKFSEGQAKSNERQSSKELDEQPKTSEGVEQIVEQEQVIEEKLSAEEILNSKAMNDKWMKRVSSDLGAFLSNKFYRQLEVSNINPEEASDAK